MLDITPVGRGLRDLPGQARGGHLTAGHTVDGIVDEDDGDILVSCGRVNRFGHTDGGKVAIALIGEDDAVGAAALDARGNGGGTAVGGLNHIAGEVVVRHNGTADGGHTDGLPLDAQLVHHLGHEAVDDAVRATGAVVHRHVIECLRFFKNDSHD